MYGVVECRVTSGGMRWIGLLGLLKPALKKGFFLIFSEDLSLGSDHQKAGRFQWVVLSFLSSPCVCSKNTFLWEKWSLLARSC